MVCQLVWGQYVLVEKLKLVLYGARNRYIKHKMWAAAAYSRNEEQGNGDKYTARAVKPMSLVWKSVKDRELWVFKHIYQLVQGAYVLE